MHVIETPSFTSPFNIYYYHIFVVASHIFDTFNLFSMGVRAFCRRLSPVVCCGCCDIAVAGYPMWILPRVLSAGSVVADVFDRYDFIVHLCAYVSYSIYLHLIEARTPHEFKWMFTTFNVSAHFVCVFCCCLNIFGGCRWAFVSVTGLLLREETRKPCAARTPWPKKCVTH